MKFKKGLIVIELIKPNHFFVIVPLLYITNEGPTALTVYICYLSQ